MTDRWRSAMMHRSRARVVVAQAWSFTRSPIQSRESQSTARLSATSRLAWREQLPLARTCYVRIIAIFMSTRTSGVAASTWTHGEPPRVMVMCDQPLLVDLVALTLNHGVCSVRTVTSAEQVPMVAADWQPHLIILDLALNGSQTVQHIRTSGRAGSSTLVMGLVGPGDLQSNWQPSRAALTIS